MNPIPQVPSFNIGSIESSGLSPSAPFIRPWPATNGKSLTLKFFNTPYLCINDSFAKAILSSNNSKNFSTLPLACIPILGKFIVVGAIFPLPLQPGSPLTFFIRYVLHPIVAGIYPLS